MNITALVEDFVKQIIAATEASAAERVQEALAAAFGASQKRGPGRPKKGGQGLALVKAAPVNPKLARARKLQGQYLGALKGLGETDRAKVKAVAKSKGVAAAVKLAASLKKK